MDNLEEETMDKTTEVEETTDELSEDSEQEGDVSEERDYKAEAAKLAAEKVELEKKLKTALIQKEKKDIKLQKAESAASNNDVQSLKAEIELIKFQTQHSELAPDEIKLVQRFKQEGKTLEETMEDSDVKELLEIKRMKKEMDESIPNFGVRSSVSKGNGMSSLEKTLAGNLPI